ncbi:MAG: sel1 repeat family protein [Paludibacteraceae bacterium]|nr:sel1 repeat family protein [Paludibacteraceae bacterium]
MKKFGFIIFLMMAPVLMVAQNNMDLGRQNYERLQSKYLTSYERSSYAKNALTYLQEAAKEGYGEACYYLGNIYREGTIVEQDYAIAMNMYKKALEFGHDVGETEIGDMYLYGQGVEENEPEAVKYYTQSMENGNLSGKHMLGVCYYRGWGVTPDTTKACSLLERYLIEAEGGRDGHHAFSVLGDMLQSGKKVYVTDHYNAVKPLKNSTKNIAMLYYRSNRVYYMKAAANLMYNTECEHFSYGKSYSDPDANSSYAAGLLKLLIDLTYWDENYSMAYFMYAKSVLRAAGYSDLIANSFAYYAQNYRYTPTQALEVAAERNVYYAAQMLANMYTQGVLVSKNPSIAMQYKQQANNILETSNEEWKKTMTDTLYRNQHNFYQIGDTYVDNGEKYIVADCGLDGKPTLLLPLTHTGAQINTASKCQLATLPQYYQVWIYIDVINKGLVREGAQKLTKMTLYCDKDGSRFTFKSGLNNIPQGLPVEYLSVRKVEQ